MTVFLSACGRKQVRVNPPQSPTQPQSPPAAVASNELEGLASYYAEPYHGRKTASGEVFDSYKDLTAAHRTLPFDTLVRVTNKSNGRAVDVRINDRGPFVDGRVIDLSFRAATQIDMVRAGVVPVKLTVLKAAEVKRAAFAVQVASFLNRGAAEDLKHKLDRRYSGVTIQTVSEDQVFYRVRIGMSDQDAARRLVSELRKDDFKPFGIRLN